MIKKYGGQTLAIVLVLLIVGSIIGFALYARLGRESQRIVDEKSASESDQLVDTIVGLISTSDYEQVKGSDALNFFECDEETLRDDGCSKEQVDLTTLQGFFEALGSDSIDFEEFGIAEDPKSCLSDLSMRYSLPDDEITIEKDDVYSIFVDKVDDWGSCNIKFFMTDSGSSDGFVLSTFYKDGDNYESYGFEDIVGYGYEGKTNLGGNWTSYVSGVDKVEFPAFSPGVGRDVDFLSEIRFKSLGGSSNLRWEASNCDIEDYLVMKVGATCGGKNVVRSFVIPGQVFAPPLFDYVLFNGQGELKPEPISVED